MSLKLDKAKTIVETEVVTDYVIERINIDTKNGKLTISYETFNEGVLVGCNQIHLEDTSTYLSIKNKLYTHLKDNLDLIGKVE